MGFPSDPGTLAATLAIVEFLMTPIISQEFQDLK
jgi:hypothetical protein